MGKFSGLTYTPLATTSEPQKQEDGDFVRGLKKAAYQIPQTAGGALALAGDALGSEGLRDYGLSVYQNNSDKIDAITKDSDSLTNVLQGDASGVDWAQNAAGYVAGQVGTAIVTGGAGGFIGRQLALRGIKGVAERAIESQMAKQVAEKVAAKGVKYGAGAGLFGSNLTQEAGSIYPEALHQAHQEGRELTGGDLARVGGAALGAAVVDTGADAIMAGRVLKGGRKAGEGIGRAAMREIPGAMLREGATEGIQTGIERYGAGQDLSTADAIRDYVDSMGVGALGGGMGGAASILHAQKVQESGPLSRAANVSIDQQILALGHDPQPLISFPDGSVGHKQDLEAYLTQFPEGEERTKKRREIMGRDPETGKRIEPEPEPEPLVANSPEAEKAMLGSWASKHDPVMLDYAHALINAPGAKDHDLMIVPHPKGHGYTVVPSRWLTLDTQARAAALQKGGDAAMLPAPDRAAPGGAIRVDSQGEAAPETYGEQVRTSQKQRAAQAKREEFDVSVPHGTKAKPREQVVPAQAGTVEAPAAAPEPQTIYNPSGKPFMTEFAAKRKLKEHAATHELAKVEDGWVLTPKAQPATEGVANGKSAAVQANDGATGAPGATTAVGSGAAGPAGTGGTGLPHGSQPAVAAADGKPAAVDPVRATGGTDAKPALKKPLRLDLKTPEGSTYSILNEKGEYVGVLSTRENAERVQLHLSGIEDEAYRGTGLGTAAYEQLIREALGKGKVFVSDGEVSPAAQRVYESLAKKGYKVEKNPKAKLEDDGKLTSRGWGVYRITAAPEATESAAAPAQGAFDFAAPTPEAIAEAAHEAATSPHNDLPEPTEAQKHAGNYKVGRIKLHGLDISIENPQGSVRKGVSPDGKAWENTLAHHYGYIRSLRQTGNDLVKPSGVGDVKLTSDAANAHPGGKEGGDLAKVVDVLVPRIGAVDPALSQGLSQGVLADAKGSGDTGTVAAAAKKIKSLLEIPGESAGTGIDSLIDQAARNSVAADAHFFGNAANADALRAKGFDSLNVQSKAMVKRNMLASIHDLKVREAIVQLIPVHVVDMLTSGERPAKAGLDNKAMLLDRLATASTFNDPVFVGRFVDAVSSSLPVAFASSVAKEHAALGVGKSVGTDGKGGAAGGAGNGNSHKKYISTIGADGDHIDTFIGPNPESGKVFVVDQVDPKTGKWDEHKVLLGFDSEAEARAGYEANYEKGWKGGKAITETDVDGFKAWLKDGDTTKPFAPQQGVAEFEHNGTRIYPIKLRNPDGGEPLARWAVESSENRVKREAGERHGMGDAIHDTAEQAKAAADRQRMIDERAAQQDERDRAEAARMAEQQAAAKAETYNGFLDGKPENTKALIRKALAKQYRFDGKVMTVRERIESLLAAGELRTSTLEEPRIKPMSRLQFNRASNAEQAAHERRMREAGNKITHLVSDSELGKTAYDYAQHLLASKEKTDVRTQTVQGAHQEEPQPREKGKAAEPATAPAVEPAGKAVAEKTAQAAEPKPEPAKEVPAPNKSASEQTVRTADGKEFKSSEAKLVGSVKKVRDREVHKPAVVGEFPVFVEQSGAYRLFTYNRPIAEIVEPGAVNPTELAPNNKPKALQERDRKVAQRAVARGDVESTAQGMLVTAREAKANAYKQVKSLRERIKNGDTHLRVDLLKAEDRWREYQRMERRAEQQIAEDAARQGLTLRGKKTDQPAEQDDTLRASVQESGMQDELHPSTFYSDKTIEVDGKRRPVTNSKGQLVAPDAAGQIAFWKWFKDSAVVDEQGRPMAVYHGTNSDFENFELGKGAAQSEGFFFAGPESTRYVEFYVNQLEGGNQRTIPAYLSLENPKLVKASWDDGTFSDPDFENQEIAKAKREGHDGVIFSNPDTGEKFYVALSPDQIKSATGNAGTFDPESADITAKAGQSTTSPMDSQIAGMVREGASVDKVLAHIEQQSGNADYRTLAAALRKLGLKTGILFERATGTYTAGVEAGMATAAYKASTDTAYLHQEEGAEQGVLHELIHAATLKALAKGGLAAQQMKALWNHVKSLPNFAGEYGITNEEEFVAEAYTNPAFRQKLADTPAPNAKLSLWQKLVGIVRILLGKPAISDNVLDRVMSTGEALMQENKDGETSGDVRPSGEAFKRWFGNSKVVDADGKPLVVYHGTFDSFGSFDPSKTEDGAFHFGTAEAATERLAGKHGTIRGRQPIGQNVAPVYLSIQNPKRLKQDPVDPKSWRKAIAKAKEEGYDGIVYSNSIEAPAATQLPEDVKELPSTTYKGGTMLVSDSLGVLADLSTREAAYEKARYRIGRGIVMVPNDSWVAFYPQQIKSAIGNNGQFDPANPDLRASVAHGRLNAAMANGVRESVLTDLPKKLGNRLADFRGIGLQALGRRQLVDIYAGDFQPDGRGSLLTRYSELMQRMDADKNEAGAEADGIADRWGKLKDGDKLADLMHDATLAQIDPAKEYVAGDNRAEWAGLKNRYNALSPEAQAIYREARDAYDKHWQKVRAEVRGRIQRAIPESPRRAALLEKMDATFYEKVKGVYFPLARFGDYVVSVTGKGGERLAVSFAETMNEADALRKSLMKKFPADQGYTVSKVTKKKEFNPGRDAVSRGFMQELHGVLDQYDSGGELQDDINQLYLNSMPDLSWAKHGIHRKGTPGFSQDARRAFAQNMFHGARYLAKLRYGDRLGDLLMEMQDHVDGKAQDQTYDSVKAQQVVDEMNKRHDAYMSPNTNPLSSTLTSLGFIFYLGLSPASAAVNLSQTPLVTLPMLAAKYGFGKASAALLNASKQAAANKNDISKALSGDELRAYREAVDAGVIDVSMAHDLAGIAAGDDTTARGKLRPVMKWASWMFHHGEKFNRQATLMAAYRLARDAGQNHEAAYKSAVEEVYASHFDYASSNRPRIMQGNVARVVFLFKQYAQNMVYTLSRNAVLAAKGDKVAQKTLAGLLISHAMAAGVLGLPVVGTLLAAASAIGGDDDEPWDAKVALRNYMADLIGQKPAEVMMHGLSRLGPFDISGRVGLDKLLLPDVQEGLEGARAAEAWMTSALGPVAGIGLSTAKGLNTMAKGDVMRGLEDMLPTSIKNPLKAIRYATEGVKDKTGIPIVDDTTALEELGQMLGFSPSRAREAQEGKGAVYQAEHKLNDRRQALIEQWTHARMAGDSEGVAEIQQEIARFNDKNPARRITPANQTQSLRNRNRRLREAEDGIYLPRKHQDVRDLGRFASAD